MCDQKLYRRFLLRFPLNFPYRVQAQFEILFVVAYQKKKSWLKKHKQKIDFGMITKLT